MRSYTPGLSIQFSAASTNIPMGSYVTVANSSAGYQSGKLMFYNSTGQILLLGYGAAGSESKWLTIPPTANFPIIIEALFTNNTRIAVTAVDAPANTGFLTLDFLI